MNFVPVIIINLILLVITILLAIADKLLFSYGECKITVHQEDDEKDFVVDLVITGVDTGIGVIQRITNVISNNLEMNIKSFSIDGKDGYFEGKVSLIVLNKIHLNKAVTSLESLEGVLSVVRKEYST